MIKNYITPNPKIIIMIRPIIEILESFYYIYKKNNALNVFEKNMFEETNPLMFPLQGLKQALSFNSNYILLVTYKELVENPKKTIKEIYNFLEIPKFGHNFDYIENSFPEDDY
jgi:hypothetical protein